MKNIFSDRFQNLTLEENEESKTFLDGALRISRTGYRQTFRFKGRLASHDDFDAATEFLETEKQMMILGPLLELELADRSLTVPEGLSFAPVHFLTVPNCPDFSEALESKRDVHHVVKLTKVGGTFLFQKYGNCTRIDSEYSIATEDLKNESLCFITTVIFGFGKKPQCKHGAIKQFFTVHNSFVCPQINDALKLFCVCEGSVNNFKKEHQESEKVLDILWKANIEPSLKYKLEVTLGKKKTTFEDKISHKNLCKWNGVLPLGSLAAEYEAIDCRDSEKCKIVFEVFSKKSGKRGQGSTWKEGQRSVEFFKCEYHDHNNPRCDKTPQPAAGSDEGSLDYDTGLAKLWGVNILRALRRNVAKGQITLEEIRMMSNKMGLMKTFNEFSSKIEVEFLFDRLLEQLYKEDLFQKSPKEAKQLLVRVLSETCTKIVAVEIEKLC